MDHAFHCAPSTYNRHPGCLGQPYEVRQVGASERLTQPRAWLLEPNQGRFATWFDERSGELVDLDADTRRTLDHGAEVVALLPEAKGRFVVVVFGERVELWV